MKQKFILTTLLLHNDFQKIEVLVFKYYLLQPKKVPSITTRLYEAGHAHIPLTISKAGLASVEGHVLFAQVVPSHVVPD